MGATEGAKPHYLKLKSEVRLRIETGEWKPGDRIPSENEFVETLGISRMTVNRALRELETEGAIVRVRGKGSFVAAAPTRSSAFQTIPNIADEIRARGRRHDAVVLGLGAETGGQELADGFGVAPDAALFHSVIVHREDDLPIQLEDRWVSPAAAPDYLRQDFRAVTPNGYLSAVAPVVRAEQFIEAVLGRSWERTCLAMPRGEPCLLVRRRTWSKAGLVSQVRLLYPGTRYRLESF